LVKWHEHKAFGFIAPNGGGNQVFIHKSALTNRQRKPKVNDVITFSLTKDKQGRHCAGEATFSGEKRPKIKVKQSNKTQHFLIYLSAIFLSLLTGAYVQGYIPQKLVLTYLGVSFITFLVYALDKSKAKRGAWRIAESTFHLLALIGGWPGAAIAQQLLRHKSQKRTFRNMFYFTVIANVAALYWLLSTSGDNIMALLQ